MTVQAAGSACVTATPGGSCGVFTLTSSLKCHLNANTSDLYAMLRVDELTPSMDDS